MGPGCAPDECVSLLSPPPPLRRLGSKGDGAAVDAPRASSVAMRARLVGHSSGGSCGDPSSADGRSVWERARKGLSSSAFSVPSEAETASEADVARRRAWPPCVCGESFRGGNSVRNGVPEANTYSLLCGGEGGRGDWPHRRALPSPSPSPSPPRLTALGASGRSGVPSGGKHGSTSNGRFRSGPATSPLGGTDTRLAPPPPPLLLHASATLDFQRSPFAAVQPTAEFVCPRRLVRLLPLKVPPRRS